MATISGSKTCKPPHSFSMLMLRNDFHRKNVSIQREIESYRRQQPGKVPLVLIDLMHIDQIPMGTKRETNLRNFCGPDLDLLGKIDSLLHFLRHSCRVELVCFIDGPHSRDNYEDKFGYSESDRKNNRYDNDIRVIDAIQGQLEDYGAFRAPTDRILFDSIKTLAKRYGTLWHALTNARRLEISRYAVEHGAMAVLGKSSDWLLHIDALPLKVWYVPSLDLGRMEVTEFDYDTVCLTMGLNTAQKRHLMAAVLPASVIGSNVFEYDVQLTYNLVKELPANITEAVYKDVAKKLFRSTNKAKSLQEACEQVYDTARIELSVQEDQLTGFAYDILHNRTSTITLMLNDLRYWESKDINMYQLVVSLYGRLAGVVLARHDRHQAELAPIRQRIRAKQSHAELFGYHYVEVELPRFELTPGKEATDRIEEWNLACCAFVLGVDTLPAERIRRLANDEKHRLKLLDHVTIFDMVQKLLITSDMADIILLAIEHHFDNDSSDDWVNRTPTTLHMEAFHATFMYIRWRFYIYEVLVNCGFPDMLIDKETRLSGVKLQNLYSVYLSDPGSLRNYGINGIRQRRLYE